MLAVDDGQAETGVGHSDGRSVHFARRHSGEWKRSFAGGDAASWRLEGAESDVLDAMTPAVPASTRPWRALSMLAAAGAWLAGAILAAHHPLHPHLALLGYAAWCWIAWRSDSAPIVLLAVLPMAHAGPWTGWIVFDEFDLFALGAVGAAQARTAWLCPPPARQEPLPRMPSRTVAIVWAFAATTLIAWARGFGDAVPSGGLFAGYDDRLNSVRLAKSAIYALLLLPSLREAARRSERDLFLRTAIGMACGAVVVSVAAIWERWAYPGLTDFSAPYRTVALFWEMHVGGAAIDVYLAMAAPFVAWTVVRASTPARFAAAAAFALLVEYVCLTTFSRGAYLAVSASLFVLTLLLARRDETRNWARARRRAVVALAAALLLQAGFILRGDSYFLRRLDGSAADLGSRLAHWRQGLALIDGPVDTLVGIGLGRFPAVYATRAPDGRVAGDARVAVSREGPTLLLKGPQGASRAGSYAPSQRTAPSAGPHDVVVELRSPFAVRLAVSLCETHLLYDRRCELGEALIEPTGTWQRVRIALHGPPIPESGAHSRATVFSLHLPEPGSTAEIRSVMLAGDAAVGALRNAEFEDGLARWYPVARDDFAPWHIDSLPFEVLIERGVLGLAAIALLIAHALYRLLAARNRASIGAPVLAASLTGALVVGLVSSVFDAPRIGFLLLYLVAVSLVSSERPPPVQTTRAEP